MMMIFLRLVGGVMMGYFLVVRALSLIVVTTVDGLKMFLGRVCVSGVPAHSKELFLFQSSSPEYNQLLQLCLQQYIYPSLQYFC